MAPHLLLLSPSPSATAPQAHRRFTTAGLRPACPRPLLKASPLPLPLPLGRGSISLSPCPGKSLTTHLCPFPSAPTRATLKASSSSASPSPSHPPSPCTTRIAAPLPPPPPAPLAPMGAGPARQGPSPLLAAALATLLLLASPAQALAFPGSLGSHTLRGEPQIQTLQRGVGGAEGSEGSGAAAYAVLQADPVSQRLRDSQTPSADPALGSLGAPVDPALGALGAPVDPALGTPAGPALGALSRLSPYASPDAVRIPLPELEVDPREEYVRAGVRPDIDLEDAIDLSGVRRDKGGIPSTEPQQVHISLWGPQRMLVTWVTSDHSAPSVVDYGTDPGDLPRTADGTAESYSYVVYKSGAVHRVVIGTEEEPLKPNTTYYYRCGKEGREMSFKTPPDRFPLNVAIVGDLGQTGWTVSTLEHIEEQPHDMLVLPGDLSYADRYQPRWDSWGHLVEPLASARPWMVVAGNHEEEDIPLLEPERFKAYNTRWPLPAPVSPVPSPSNLYYSFETAGVHWVMLASYDDYDPGSEQYQWLEQDLAKVDRGRTPWLVAVLHAPWYNSNTAHQGDGEGMRRAMEGLLYAHGTDLLFAGHVHAYERSAPVFGGDNNPCGIVHVTIGDGGNYEGLATRYRDPVPEWSVMREASFGHGELAFHEDGTADWSWHRNQDDESVVADAVRLLPHPMRVRAQEPGAAKPVMCTASK